MGSTQILALDHDAFANINRVSAGACYRFVRANDYALIADAVEDNALADVSARMMIELRTTAPLPI